MALAATYLDNAQTIMDQTRANRVTLREVLPEADQIAFSTETPGALLKQFGEAYRNYLTSSLNSEKIRNACILASEELGSTLNYGKTATTLAAYNLGSCMGDELSLDVWLRAFESGIPARRIYVASETKNYNHVFVLFGITVEEWEALYDKHDGNFFNIMNDMKKGVIVDPYLNAVCEAKDFAQSETANYCRQSRITNYQGSTAHPPAENVEVAKELVRAVRGDAELIGNLAQQNLNTVGNTSAKIKNLTRILSAISKTTDNSRTD